MHTGRIAIVLAGLGLAAGVCLTAPAGAQSGPADHLKCYTVKDGRTNQNYSVDLVPDQPGFSTATTCRVKAQARQLCIPVDKENVSPSPFPTDPGSATGAFLCYDARCPREPDVTVTVNDQLRGSRQVTARGRARRRLCTPVASPAPTTTLPTTTLPTTTTTATTSTSTVTASSTTTTTVGSATAAFVTS